jgi:hypothetical protein
MTHRQHIARLPSRDTAPAVPAPCTPGTFQAAWRAARWLGTLVGRLPLVAGSSRAALALGVHQGDAAAAGAMGRAPIWPLASRPVCTASPSYWPSTGRDAQPAAGVQVAHGALIWNSGGLARPIGLARP